MDDVQGDRANRRKKLLPRVEQLPPTDRKILEALSLMWHSGSRADVAKVGQRGVLTSRSGKALSHTNLQPIAKSLAKLELIEWDDVHMRCEPAIADAVTRRLFERDADLASQLCGAVRARLPLYNTTYYNPYPHSAERALREIRLATILGNIEELRNLVSEAWASFEGPWDGGSPLAEVWGRLDDPEWMLTFRAEVVAEIVSHTLTGRFVEVEDGEDAIALGTGVLERHPNLGALRWGLVEQHLLRGELDRVRALRVDDRTVGFPMSGAMLALIDGDLAAAQAGFEKAVKALKKASRKRNIALPGPLATFYPWLFLRSGEPKDVQAAHRYLAGAQKSDRLMARTEHQFLGEVASMLRGQPDASVSRYFDEVIRYDVGLNGTESLFLGLAAFWIGGRLTKREKNLLAKCRDKLEEQGYLWLAAEHAALLVTTSAGKDARRKHATVHRRLREQVGGVALVDAIQVEPPWARKLGLLAAIAGEGPSPSEPAASDKRLAWRVRDRGWGVQVEPYEQKRTKKGWTKGRRVALKRLATEIESFEYLTDQDRKVCATIEAYEESGGYRRYYGRKTVYELDGEAACRALVGHPNVFLDRAPDERVDVVEEKLELNVELRAKQFHVTMVPDGFDEGGGIRLDEERRQLVFVSVTKAQRQMLQILGREGLLVPRSGESKVAETIGALSSLVPVRSDILAEGAKAERVEASTLPRLRLRPVGRGLRADLVVRPLGEGTVTVLPGTGAQVVVAEVTGQQRQAERDLKVELERARTVLAACPTLEAGAVARWEWALPEPEDCLEALDELGALGDDVVLEWPEGRPFTIRARPTAAQMRLAIKGKDEWFSVTGQLTVDEEKVFQLRELLELVEATPGRFLEIGDGQFVALTGSFHRLLQELAAISSPRGKGLRVHPLASGIVEDLAADAERVRTDAAWKDHLAHLAEAEALVPELPATLDAELRPYQEEGYRWLVRLATWGVGACLADDMGLGKTVEALALLLERAPRGPALVVAPTSVSHNWLDEAHRFAPTLRPRFFGTGDRQAMLDEAGPFDVIVCSYGLLQSESKRLAALEWSTVVLDEAQAIKNMTTKRSKAAMQLRAEARIITTGTPIENRLGELWNLFRFLNPGLLGSLEQFNKRFAVPIERDGDREARRRLRRLVQPFVLRRTKAQVLPDLPPRTTVVRKVELSGEEAALYEALRQGAVERLADTDAPGADGTDQRFRILAELMKLRRACCHPSLVVPGTTLSGAKLEALVEIIEELRAGRHRALVFSQFVDHLSVIRHKLDELGVTYQYLDGSTPTKQRRRRVAAFQSGESDLFLISLRAGGTGLNLTAADYVVHMDPWWNPAVEDQGSDRAHRIGQERPVTIYKLVTQGTIEEKIIDLHRTKRELAEGLLAGAESIAKVDAAELLALIRKG